jgi:Fe-S-cluster containining protein
MADEQALQRFKEHILKEYPRLGRKDTFKFACHPKVPCFNRCCHDVNIFLTPYDVLRLKNRLGITSGQFIDDHTIIPFSKELRMPLVALKMKEDSEKACPFLGPAGCTVYEDRPWACRMYPLGMASPADNPDQPEEQFYFLLKEEHCEGHCEDREWTVEEWIADQGIEIYDEMGERFKQISLHGCLQKGPPLDPKKMEMLFTACYDLDRFRRFVFESTFLQRFDLDEQTLQEIREDDAELLKFGFRWVRFCIFGEQTLSIREEAKPAKPASNA